MTLKQEIIEISVQEFINPAKMRAEQMGALKLSMRGMEANQVGALGELVGMQHLRNLGIEFREVFSTTHDVEFIHNGQVKTLEFKTKERTVTPEEYFDCTVPKYNHTHQRPDYYMFISLLSTGKSSDIRRFRNAFILGSMTRERFDQVAKPWTPKQVDSTNNWSPTIDCYNVPIIQLAPPTERVNHATI
jgi:hypothetical protein